MNKPNVTLFSEKEKVETVHINCILMVAYDAYQPFSESFNKTKIQLKLSIKQI